jgi:oligoendopeptidase F
MKTSIPALLLALACTGAFAATERPQDRWNLADLYPSVDAWNQDYAKVETALTKLGDCKGQLGQSAARLLECTEMQYAALRTYLRLLVYAAELSNQDMGVPENLQLRQRTQVLGAKLTQATAFARPELLALGKERVEGFLREEPRLAPYRHPIDDILRAAPHTLDTAGEAILAQFALAAGQAGQVYNIFSNSEVPWSKITLADGTEVKVDHSGYEKTRQSPNRDDRKKAMDAFFGKWKEFERTMGVAFYGKLKEDTVYTRLRKYPDSITRSLDGNKIPRAVYDTLIASTNEHLPTLHRYFRLRAKMLGVSQMRYYDIYPPLVGGSRVYPIDEGIQIMFESLKPLGAEYVAAIRKGIDERWMDTYPRPRKQTGAHVFGVAYDVHPYVLMNYNEDYQWVSTLVHEWGHAIHTYLSNKHQPFSTARYATFVAEIASTTNEVLLLDYMLQNAKSDDERLLFLGSALENLRATFFRQAMFAEFEQKVHDVVDKGGSLTGDQLTKIYGELQRRYHGQKEGVMTIDGLYNVEWAYIPHFYSSFYVFQYATSIAAGSLFGQAILEGRPGAREKYLKLLSSGASDYPYELVKEAGVDLATKAPYDAVAAKMNRIMDEMEGILARKK